MHAEYGGGVWGSMGGGMGGSMEGGYGEGYGKSMEVGMGGRMAEGMGMVNVVRSHLDTRNHISYTNIQKLKPVRVCGLQQY